MADRFAAVASGLREVPSRDLRRRVALTVAAVIIIACAIASTLLLKRADKERHDLEHRAMDAVAALSYGFDQEVAAVNYLLKGLSRSPPLLSGDLRAFYEQLKSTPVPDGAWINLNDLERQLINTSRPFGAQLPKHSDFINYKEQLNRIRERHWTVSGRMLGLVSKTVVIALSLRLNDSEGHMSGFLTTILPEARLQAILEEHSVPAGWTKGVYDRKLQPIVIQQNGERRTDTPAPSALVRHLAGIAPHAVVEGALEAEDERGTAIFVVFRHSAATNWTVVVTVPRAALGAPLRAALWHLSWIGLLMLLVGALAVHLIARQTEQPLRSMYNLVNDASARVNELSDQLLELQEEERRRIARELHDSTAQHIVAANLGLAGLAAKLGTGMRDRAAIAKIEELLREALRELRIFTYLLHPPSLAQHGLFTTLRAFVDGFSSRTGIAATVRIPPEFDDMPTDLQRTLLRVVQESLTNVFRHARASCAWVEGRLTSRWLILRIRDNGAGLPAGSERDGSVRMGVGIAGMRGRLEQFGGELRIRSNHRGTTVMAVVPLSATGRTMKKARRLLLNSSVPPLPRSDHPLAS